ncbi:unnamed protein product, partial [marine sediment metagenome]
EFALANRLLSHLIGNMKRGMYTYKQAQLLKKFGYHSPVTRVQATGIIDQIKANGWKMPRYVRV